MRRKNRQFCIEQLEARQMMAGDVAASVDRAGNLFLTEAVGQAGGDNGVLISQIDNTHIRVEGTASNGGAKSLINGAAFKDFTVVGHDLNGHVYI